MDKPILLTAIRAALEAGKEIMAVYTDPNSDFEIEKKADNYKRLLIPYSAKKGNRFR